MVEKRKANVGQLFRDLSADVNSRGLQPSIHPDSIEHNYAGDVSWPIGASQPRETVHIIPAAIRLKLLESNREMSLPPYLVIFSSSLSRGSK